METTQSSGVDRLTMAEVILDATLQVLIKKGVLTNKDIQDEILANKSS